MRPAPGRAAYLGRILRVYLHRRSGPLSFWYERPEIDERTFDGTGAYYMRFAGKARYGGPFDDGGIPLLDYQGEIGRQYNPIAIAQYGLARFNQWLSTRADVDRLAWIRAADWLARSMRTNRFGVPVWMHDFDWPYRQTLVAPWYSGLAQGNGLSMLVRAARETGDRVYEDAAHAAFESLTLPVDDGGTLVTNSEGDLWIEEYLIDPPSHILNGFIWALWGVYDYAHWSGNQKAHEIWARCVSTLEKRLGDFDTGWWSLYEARWNGREMLASGYYHQLHITQLRVMHRLTGNSVFDQTAVRFQRYADNPVRRTRAFVQKAAFKLRHY